MDKTVGDILEKVYFNTSHPASYSGLDKLYRAVKDKNITKGQVKKWLQSQEHYTVQKQSRQKFKRRRVIVPYMYYQADVDTANMKRYTKQNNGYAHFLVVIDCFSKKAYTKALKSLTGKEMVEAIKSIFKDEIPFTRWRSDMGVEFNNKDVKKYLKSQNVKHFVTHNTEIKANIAERLIKTLKSKMYRYMSNKNTHHWIDQLQSITDSYNNTFHRSIQQSPASVTKKDESKIWKLLYENHPKPKPKRKHPPKAKNPFRFKLNDTVRISSIKQPFEKEVDETWTREHYLVSDRFVTESIAQYKLKDISNEPLLGTYYQYELQKVYIQPDATYLISKILRKKGKGKNQMMLVQWLGWNKKHSTWIRASELINYQKVET